MAAPPGDSSGPPSSGPPSSGPTAPSPSGASSAAPSGLRGLRDRHGRGMRGPALLSSAYGAPRRRTERDRFDDLVLAVVTGIESRWASHLGLVEYAVEDAPQVPDDWEPGTVPLSSLVRGSGSRPSRLVVFRRPIEHRSASRADLEALILTVLVEQVAELLGIDPEVVDPRVGRDE